MGSIALALWIAHIACLTSSLSPLQWRHQKSGLSGSQLSRRRKRQTQPESPAGDTDRSWTGASRRPHWSFWSLRQAPTQVGSRLGLWHTFDTEAAPKSIDFSPDPSDWARVAQYQCCNHQQPSNGRQMKANFNIVSLLPNKLTFRSANELDFTSPILRTNSVEDSSAL